MPAKRLALLRHAKSSWADPRLDDHDRPLTSRGRKAASRMGEYLRDEGVRPDLVLCSSAVRARETLERLDLSPGTDVLVEDELYGASAATIVDRLRRVPDAFEWVLLIGHNPAVQDVAISLLDDPNVLPEKFPTAALADLRLAVTAWAEVRPGVADLQRFVTPRSLA